MIEERLADRTNRELVDVRLRDACRFVGLLAANDGDPYAARTQFEMRWPTSPSNQLITKALELRVKAPVLGATPDVSGWGGPLVPSTLATAIVAFAQPHTVLGRLERLRR